MMRVLLLTEDEAAKLEHILGSHIELDLVSVREKVTLSRQADAAGQADLLRMVGEAALRECGWTPPEGGPDANGS